MCQVCWTQFWLVPGAFQVARDHFELMVRGLEVLIGVFVLWLLLLGVLVLGILVLAIFMPLILESDVLIFGVLIPRVFVPEMLFVGGVEPRALPRLRVTLTGPGVNDCCFWLLMGLIFALTEKVSCWSIGNSWNSRSGHTFDVGYIVL